MKGCWVEHDNNEMIFISVIWLLADFKSDPPCAPLVPSLLLRGAHVVRSTSAGGNEVTRFRFGRLSATAASRLRSERPAAAAAAATQVAPFPPAGLTQADHDESRVEVPEFRL